MTRKNGRRARRLATPKQQARIVELRRTAPWLSLRSVAAALKLSLHAVRAAIANVDRLANRHRRLRQKRRCGVCGRQLIEWPCRACSIEGAKDRPGPPSEAA